MNPRDLTPSERMFLFRRRLGYDQRSAAKAYGMTTKEWRLMETGDRGPIPAALQVRSTIHDWERMMIWRRRTGLSVKELAVLRGVSHITIHAHEQGHGKWQETFTWWKANLRTEGKHPWAAASRRNGS